MTSGGAELGGTVALSIEHARKSYGRSAVGRVDAVSDVSLSVSQGAIHGLLGPNGAGKTTTLKMLLGLVKPTGGTFEIMGRPAHVRGARAGLGFLPEQPYFPSHLTAGEVMLLSGRLGGHSKDTILAQAPQLLARVGLEGRQDDLLSRFSRGMLQRLGLAQALVGDPAVIVLDEPASGLDPVGQRDVRRIMLDLKEAGTTILLSSHQLSEVEAVCDEVTILNRGLVAARGHIDELLDVRGKVAIRAIGVGGVPERVAAVALEADSDSEGCSVRVPDSEVRAVIDAFYDAGWRVESVVPSRMSLEDFFARMMSEAGDAA